MAADFDRLSLTEAIRLCTRRHEELSSSEIKLIGKLGAAETVKPAEALRLAAVVRRLRQGSILAEIGAARGST
jgi:hypothetical protein